MTTTLTDADLDRIADAVPVDQFEHCTTWHRRFARAVLAAAQSNQSSGNPGELNLMAAQPLHEQLREMGKAHAAQPAYAKQFDRLCDLLPYGASWGDSLTPAIVQGICELLAAQPAPAEPVAVFYCPDSESVGSVELMAHTGPRLKHGDLLYAHPPAQPAPVPEMETRADGKLVRVDRWEWGIRRIVALLWGNRKGFEIDEVVQAIKELVPYPHEDDESLCNSVERLSAAPVPVPPGWKLAPVEPTPEMLAAYLVANTNYWKEVDAKPFDATKKWRQGTPSDATRESYKAMIAASPEVPRG
jgi:hypothetical protein